MIVDELISLCSKYGEYTERRGSDVWYINFNDNTETILISNIEKVGGRLSWYRDEGKVYVDSFNSFTGSGSIDVEILDGDVQYMLLDWAKKAIE